MAILPIDIQTILGQMNTAGKIQHNIEHSPVNQQAHQGNVIHQQSVQKDHQVSTLENTDNQDKKVDPDAEKKQNLSSQSQKKSDEEKKEEKKDAFFKDPEKGNFIDVKK